MLIQIVQGISLPLAQYSTLVSLLPSIEAALAAKGESVPRPDYSTVQPSEKPRNSEDEEGDENDEGDGDGDGGKKNFEATSEEDE